MRAVVARLEQLALLNPQRAVYESVKVFVNGCNAFQRKQAARVVREGHGAVYKEYSYKMYEYTLAYCRELGIIPDLKRRARVLIHPYDGNLPPFEREAWIVAPHDFLTHKHAGACHFVGFGKSPAFPIEPIHGPKIWVPQYGGAAAGDVRATLGSRAGDVRVTLGSPSGDLAGDLAGDELVEQADKADNI